MVGQPYPQTPVLEMPIAVVALVCNIVLPGLGTVIAGVVGHQRLIGRGIAQLLLALIIVGWFWALATGIQALTNASWAGKNQAPRPA